MRLQLVGLQVLLSTARTGRRTLVLFEAPCIQTYSSSSRFAPSCGVRLPQGCDLVELRVATPTPRALSDVFEVLDGAAAGGAEAAGAYLLDGVPGVDESSTTRQQWQVWPQLRTSAAAASEWQLWWCGANAGAAGTGTAAERAANAHCRVEAVITVSQCLWLEDQAQWEPREELRQRRNVDVPPSLAGLSLPYVHAFKEAGAHAVMGHLPEAAQQQPPSEKVFYEEENEAAVRLLIEEDVAVELADREREVWRVLKNGLAGLAGDAKEAFKRRHTARRDAHAAAAADHTRQIAQKDEWRVVSTVASGSPPGGSRVFVHAKSVINACISEGGYFSHAFLRDWTAADAMVLGENYLELCTADTRALPNVGGAERMVWLAFCCIDHYHR